MQEYQSSKGMHLFILFLILLLPIFLYQQYRVINAKKSADIIQNGTFYELHDQAPMNHTFMVVVPVEDDYGTLERNIKSLTAQSYPDFQVAYVCRGERLKRKVASELKAAGNESARVVSGESFSEFVAAYAAIVAGCPDEHIIVHLPVNEWFAHEKALECINKMHQNQDVWLAYPQFLYFPSFHKGDNRKQERRIIPKKRLHRSPWIMAHCKTFYAELFKRSYREVGGSELSSLNTLEELLFPIAEVGRKHIRFIPEALYVHNVVYKKALSLGEVAEQGAKEVVCRSETKVSDALIFSQDNPRELSAFLHAMQQSVDGIRNVVVLHTSEDKKAFERLAVFFDDVAFIDTSDMDAAAFKRAVLSIVSPARGRYVVMTQATPRFVKDISIRRCLEALEHVGGSALYLHLGNAGGDRSVFEGALRYSATQFVGNGFYAWDMKRGKNTFSCPDTLAFTLYDRESLYDLLERSSFCDVAGLKKAMRSWGQRQERALFNIDASVVGSE